MNRQPPSPFWNTLDRIQATLGLDAAEFADCFALTEREFTRLRQAGRSPKVTAAFECTRRLNIAFDALLSGNIDYVALSRQFHGDRLCLPERYAQGAQSRMRTAITFLDFVERRYDWRKRSAILRRLQVNEGVFADPDQLISVRFAADLCRSLYRFDKNREELIKMGQHSAVTYSQSPFAIEMRRSRNLGKPMSSLSAVWWANTSSAISAGAFRSSLTRTAWRSGSRITIWMTLRSSKPRSFATCAGDLPPPSARLRERLIHR